jgi:hypothetical protein
MITKSMKKPTVEGALHRVRQDPDARLAVVFAAAFAWALGFALGFILGEREGAASESRQRADGS